MHRGYERDLEAGNYVGSEPVSCTVLFGHRSSECLGVWEALGGGQPMTQVGARTPISRTQSDDGSKPARVGVRQTLPTLEMQEDATGVNRYVRLERRRLTHHSDDRTRPCFRLAFLVACCQSCFAFCAPQSVPNPSELTEIACNG